MKKEEILLVDFGSQTCHLISRRFRELGIKVKIVDPEISLAAIKEISPVAIIFSGGPASVYVKDAPKITSQVFNLKIPILGICYGWQLIAYLLGGSVASGKKEYGPQELRIKNLELRIMKNLPKQFTVWLSHGDTVVKLPPGFEILGSTKDVKTTFTGDKKRKIYGLQFHPEVEHTEFGQQILKNFLTICGLKIKPHNLNLEKIISEIKKTVGKAKVIAAVSGGVDSTTAASLIVKAIGKNFIPVYIDNGLMRKGTKEEIKNIFKKIFKIKPIIVEAQELFLGKLKGVVNPEEKRKIIGKLYIDLFEKEAKKIKGAKFLAQGTIYSDVIESKGANKAAKIKSHHNVGGLPKKLGLKLLEPLRLFYKDEVRQIAKKLDLPASIINKQPFPGPGQAIRIIGEVTAERLAKQHQADKIVLEELKKVDLLEKVFQSFPIMTGIKSTAVKGDNRLYGEVVALRVYESLDVMTASWVKLPYEVLQKISSRIVNEISGISRVVYDITTKPPATMEWE